ncbi:polysaccharide pyruvyl transferase family protein [Fundicoccus ignavus]|uniref:Polysaccharide pyruvyl transferase family protein n=1 Tax=Fundicoccus ignavus TaxID=2664442 RepID=A0A844BY10_9LACT|nr:polysaccharide pyruvyl transferase family protein [Fundicoccus ignavus]MRJ46919.1 polysaccharide pyruvyl transferase family protein [Fundicoccus ignavus]
MKKIAIITLNGYFNYGNRLQNYALEKTLEKMDYKVETIKIERRPNKRSLMNSYARKIYHFIKFLIPGSKYKTNQRREKYFKDFSLHYINETKKTYEITENLSSLRNIYDAFVIGSDQVWNPSMNRLSSAFFAQFANQNQRNTYAASFGVTELGENEKNKYKKWINEIPNISVREQGGADLIKELTGREVPVHVDPTMLLTKEEWLQIGKPAPKTDKEFLLTYFLGGIPEEYRNQINRIAEDYNLNIINLGDNNDYTIYETGPSEFIDYIHNCKVFCTDSFHGVAFSILLEKDFIVFERQGGANMNSRIETILEKFALLNRTNDIVNETGDIFNTDYRDVAKILESERVKSINYLSNILP